MDGGRNKMFCFLGAGKSFGIRLLLNFLGLYPYITWAGAECQNESTKLQNAKVSKKGLKLSKRVLPDGGHV